MGVGDSLHNSGLIATLNKSGVAGTLYDQNGNAAARPCSDSDKVLSGLEPTANQVYLARSFAGSKLTTTLFSK